MVVVRTEATVQAAHGDRTHPVLVVDDDPSIRMLLSITLTDAGLRVEEACTGEEALDLVRRRPYSVVLLDNRMPGMSGMSVLTRLRADETTRTLPVLIVTAEEEVEARVNGLQHGADDYIIKPFHPAELVARVRAQIREQAAWADAVERRLAERSAIAAALCRMHPEISAERTAQVLCTEVCELRDLAGAAVVAFTADGMAVPLGLQGLAPSGLRPGVPLPPGTASRLRANAGTGPWVETVDAPVAWAPFGPAGAPVGALALVGSSGGPAAGTQLLAAAIDFAAVAGGLITPALVAGSANDARAHLADVLRRQAFSPVFQPIVALTTGAVIGFEALTRFSDGVEPQARFAEAAALNRGIDLETATLAAALRAASGLPPGAWVSVNVSPALLLVRRVLPRLVASCRVQVVLEITEHDPVEDYGELSAALAELRPFSRLSVDDAGSGFSSLRHVVTLEPEYVKLDQTWVTGIDDDPARQALVAGLGHFAAKTGSLLIAEGVETDGERGMLNELKVDLAQGFLFGRPRPAGSPADSQT